MGWRSLLEDANLIWSTLGIALGGLAAAFLAGWGAHAYARRGERAKAGKLFRESRRLHEENARLIALCESQPAPSVAPNLPPDSVQVWLRPVVEQDIQFARQVSRTPTLIVANLKGGVAKTMLSANLAVYFAKAKSKRVLLIDFDYQGSLSSMLNDLMPYHVHPQSRSACLLQTDLSDLDLCFRAVQLDSRVGGVSAFPAEYGLDDVEAREQFYWLSSSPASRDDLRFRLLRRLSSEPFKGAFDIIVIDTGPRMSTAMVAGLVAATHVIVPTTLDLRSIQAAEQFVRRVWKMAENNLCPTIQFVGVLPTLVWGSPEDKLQLVAERLRAAVEAEEKLQAWVGAKPVLENVLKRSKPIEDAAETSIPYLRGMPIRSMFDGIGAEVSARMRL